MLSTAFREIILMQNESHIHSGVLHRDIFKMFLIPQCSLVLYVPVGLIACSVSGKAAKPGFNQIYWDDDGIKCNIPNAFDSKIRHKI